MHKRQWWTAASLAFLLLSGCQTNTNNDTGSAVAVTAETVTPTDAESGSYMGIQKLYVHKADGFTEPFEFESLSSTAFEPLIRNIGSIYFISQRGGAGINDSGEDRRTMKASELPIVQASIGEQSDMEAAYIRLVCAPDIPVPGTNDMGHKDLLVYQDPEQPANAYFAVQNPTDSDEWTVFGMPGYGTWLNKELDLILRAGYGF